MYSSLKYFLSPGNIFLKLIISDFVFVKDKAKFFIFNFLAILIAFRSFRYALVTILPIGLVVSWLYGIMYIGGYSLNLVTATIGAISIGV